MKYDAIVVGSGQGGNPLTQKMAADGLKVAIIEEGLLGGTCINYGCTPTKAMVASAQAAHYARQAERWGVHAGTVEVDLPAVVKRAAGIAARSRQGWEKKFEGKDNPRLYHGKATFVGERKLTVNGETVEGERIFINAGASPLIPGVEGLAEVQYLTYVSILQLQELPSHLIVLGGGYVGLEFGQMFRRFGSEVTIIQSGPRVLPKEDDDIIDELTEALQSEGLRIIVNAKAKKAAQSATGIAITFDSPDGPQTISGSHLLVATGRRANTADLQLQNTGVQIDEKGFIKVDEFLKTSAENIWALGDINGGPQFTHISYNDFQIAYGNVFEGKKVSTRNRIVPYAVYTDPSLGRVGLTEKEARSKGLNIKIGSIPMTWVARAIERGETAGLMKIVVDAQSDKILGAAILSSEGAEVVQILHTLMLADKPYTLLKGAIYIHPTLAEGLFSLLDSVK